MNLIKCHIENFGKLQNFDYEFTKGLNTIKEENGFGKTTGLVQIEELGTLETPIALTNTLNVGLVHDAMVEYMCQQAEENNYSLMSVNPIVCECNDWFLNP